MKGETNSLLVHTRKVKRGTNGGKRCHSLREPIRIRPALGFWALEKLQTWNGRHRPCSVAGAALASSPRLLDVDFCVILTSLPQPNTNPDILHSLHKSHPSGSPFVDIFSARRLVLSTVSRASFIQRFLVAHVSGLDALSTREGKSRSPTTSAFLLLIIITP